MEENLSLNLFPSVVVNNMNKIKAARYYAKGRLKTVLMPFIDARGEEWQIFCKLWAFTSGFLYGKRKTKKGQKLSNDLIHSNKTAGYLSTIQSFFIKENWLGAILKSHGQGYEYDSYYMICYSPKRKVL